MHRIMMNSIFDTANSQEVIDLFTRVFTASEGADEGNSIGQLASDLIANTPAEDLIGCIAKSEGSIIGCIFFSRFNVPGEQVAFILAPVAVATEVQGTGVGQRLIAYGLDQLRSRNVDLALTYGDPAFYSKTGFKQIGVDTIQAPFPLSQPIGWLAQSLDGKPIEAIDGPTQCVEALNDPRHW